jgi:hypothetical protein
MLMLLMLVLMLVPQRAWRNGARMPAARRARRAPPARDVREATRAREGALRLFIDVTDNGWRVNWHSATATARVTAG